MKIGNFRLCGEVHQWMYDSFSMEKLLRAAGFSQVKIRDAAASYVADWNKFNLDTDSDGIVYKPESAYVEGIKVI